MMRDKIEKFVAKYSVMNTLMESHIPDSKWSVTPILEFTNILVKQYDNILSESKNHYDYKLEESIKPHLNQIKSSMLRQSVGKYLYYRRNRFLDLEQKYLEESLVYCFKLVDKIEYKELIRESNEEV